MNDRRRKQRKAIPPSPRENVKFDYTSDFDMWVLLDKAHFVIARSRFLEIAQYGLTKEQAQVLYVLQINGGSATQIQIADFTMRQHHSVSTLVNRMCKDGLVRKEKNRAGKGFRIFITKKGRDKYAKVTRNSIKMIFSSMPSSDRQKLASYLNQLHKTARELLGLDYKPPFLKS